MDDEVRQLERVLVGVRQASVQHELEGIASLTIRQLTLQQVFQLEAPWVSRCARRQPTGHVHDHRSEIALVLTTVLGDRSGPYTRHIATLRQLVVDGHFGLGSAQVDDAGSVQRLEHRIELLHQLQQLVTGSLCRRVTHDLNVVRDDDVGTATGQLAGDTYGFH